MYGHVRFAVVGTGYGSAVLVPAIRLDPRAKVSAIVSSTETKARSVAQKLRIEKSYGSWEEAIKDESISAVAIAVPPILQPKIMIAALKQGLAVFAEKPLAVSLIDAEKVLESACKYRMPNAVDFNFTGLPAFREARDLLSAGQLGIVRHVVVNWQVESYSNKYRLNNWKSNVNAGGGTLSNFVVHSLQYLEWLLGPIAELSARLFRLPESKESNDVAVSMSFQFASGTAGMMMVSAAAPLGSGHEIEIYGEDGTLVLRNPTTNHINGFELLFGERSNKQLISQLLTKFPNTQSDHRIMPTAHLVSRFVDWVLGGEPMDIDFRVGYRVQQLIQACRDSDRNKSWIDVRQNT